MSNPRNPVDGLRRPALLVRAARAGLGDYNRKRDLPRLVPGLQGSAPAHAVAELIQEEDKLETARKTAATNYCVMRHIDLLIALMVEARALARPDTVT